MSLAKLHITMLGTLTIIIGISTAFFALILGYLGLLNLFSLIIMVAFFNILQWFFAPHVINALYKIKNIKENDSPKLYRMVERLSMKSGIKIPKLGVAEIALPNAFAYGSPITGNHLAVTQGLLETLEEEEIEAVLGHELGHLKHRDVQIMMIISFLPSLFYLIGRSVMFTAYYGERRRDSGSYIVGTVSMLVYFILMLFTLSLSRLREYYADSHSISIIDDGPRKLSEGLAKIVLKTRNMRSSSFKEGFTFNSFKSLFISDPDRAEIDSAEILQYKPRSSDRELVGGILERRVTSADAILELFSTHPNITKRLRAIQMGI